MTGVCLEAFDLASGAASDMHCIQLNVIPDPLPTLSITPTGDVVYTMGRSTSLTLVGSHDNCLQPLQLTAVTPLPAGMQMLGAVAVPAASCNTIEAQVEWKPRYDHGGLATVLCFAVVEVPATAAQTCPHAQNQVGCPPRRRAFQLPVATPRGGASGATREAAQGDARGFSHVRARQRRAAAVS